MQTQVAQTSREANSKISLGQRKSLQDLVVEVVAAAHHAGRADLSGREIQSVIERQHLQRVEMSTLSGRITALVDAKRLVRVKNARTCTVTGQNIHPVRVVAQQAGLCY